MLCARVFYLLLLLLLAVTVVAQREVDEGDGCDWFCWIERRIDRLEEQIDLITRLLFPNDPNPLPPPLNNTGQNNTPIQLTSTFGTPGLPSSPATLIVISPSPSNTSPSTPTSPSTTADPESNTPTGPSYRTIAYYGNWNIYSRQFFPPQIPSSKLTHLLYAFASNHPNGTVYLTDPYADTQIRYDGNIDSSAPEPGANNIYGAIQALKQHKARNRRLKTMLSIGGWTYTNTQRSMDIPMATEEGRRNFAESCVGAIREFGFDGVDVDWEYPQNPTQGAQLLALLREIRTRMDAYADTLVYGNDEGYRVKPRFQLSIAAPAGANNYENYPLEEISQVTDFINLMAYDYAGSWDSVTGHAANLRPSLSNPLSTPFNTESVVNAYLAAGVPASKLVLGMPLYGRAFTNTIGLGRPYDGIGPGSFEAGVYDFRELPLPGSQVYYDDDAGATFSYDAESGTLISYDTVDMALRKVDYIIQEGMGGAMWWEVSGDRQDESGIVASVYRKLGGATGAGIESSPNWLRYPDSSFDNIRNG